MKNIGIYSCMQNNVDIAVLKYQRAVFEKFGLYIQQDVVSCSHGQYMNHIVNTVDKEYVIFFDVDCIPLTYEFYSILKADMESDVLSGAPGCANHFLPDEIYVHPCFMGFSMSLYNQCDRPNFESGNHGDTAQSFTQKCIQLNKPIKYWEITDPGDEIWELKPKNMRFGHGTIFENMIYHQYQIRFGGDYQTQFINKCKLVLGNEL